MIEDIAETLRSVLSDCLVITNPPGLYADLGLPTVGDAFPDGGSLEGAYDLSVVRVPPGDLRAFADPNLDLVFMNLNIPEDLARACVFRDREPTGAARGAAFHPAPDEEGTAG